MLKKRVITAFLPIRSKDIQSTTQQFQANGKLLLSGEYFVLDGALALAVPCQYGQSMTVKNTLGSPILHWTSKNVKEQVWFEANFSLNDFSIQQTSDTTVSSTLQKMLRTCRKQTPTFLLYTDGLKVTTHLNFPRLWGLGSSSTLIYLLAQWANVNPYLLLEKTMGGSGYDIACAAAQQAILYQRITGQPQVKAVDFNPTFYSQLHFVYLGKKQNSRDGIQHYRAMINPDHPAIEEISDLTRLMLSSTSLGEFQKLLATHEELVATNLKLPRVQDRYFSDFPGVIKSLGAWGGDFVLVASNLPSERVGLYFKEKDLEICIPYQEMIFRSLGS